MSIFSSSTVDHSLMSVFCFFFFFKQKTAYEILNVTGVQTCALPIRSEEHTSELQSHSENSYAVFCLKKKKEIRQRRPLHLVAGLDLSDSEDLLSTCGEAVHDTFFF